MGLVFRGEIVGENVADLFRRKLDDVQVLGVDFDARRLYRAKHLQYLLIDDHEARREPASGGNQQHALGGSHSTRIFPAFTTFVHFAISASTNFWNASGVPCAGSMPFSLSRVSTCGCSSARAIALLSRDTIDAGVRFGAHSPNHVNPS